MTQLSTTFDRPVRDVVSLTSPMPPLTHGDPRKKLVEQHRMPPDMVDLMGDDEEDDEQVGRFFADWMLFEFPHVVALTLDPFGASACLPEFSQM